MKIIGYKESNFTAENGTPVNGYDIWVGDERKDVVGLCNPHRQYVSVQCFARSGYTPMDLVVGDEINFNFRKYKNEYKLDTIKLG